MPLKRARKLSPDSRTRTQVIVPNDTYAIARDRAARQGLTYSNWVGRLIRQAVTESSTD